jgi:hypothetical protein
MIDPLCLRIRLKFKQVQSLCVQFFCGFELKIKHRLLKLLLTFIILVFVKTPKNFVASDSTFHTAIIFTNINNQIE